MGIKKLKPTIKELVWGTEKWLLSTHKSGESFVIDNNIDVPLSQYIGHELPILIKVIEANDTLSIQLHPDDDFAHRFENDNGKTECWYILDTDDPNDIIIGIKDEYKNLSVDEILSQCNPEDSFRSISIDNNDFIYIPPGTIHAIKSNTKLLEIQQSSNVTYRVYDWGRGRETHLDKAKKVALLNDKSEIIKNISKFDCDYFNFIKLEVKSNLTYQLNDTHCYVFVQNGDVKINDIMLSAEESALISNEQSFEIIGDATIVLSTF